MSFWGRRRGQSSANSDARIGAGESKEPELLHGTLRVKICKPEWLNDTTGRHFSQNFGEKVGLAVDLGIPKFDTTVGWDVPFNFHCAYMVSNINITLKDNGTSIGTKDVPVEDILNDPETENISNTPETEKPVEILVKHGLVIVVKLQYFDAKEDDNWGQGIGSPKFPGVPNAFFPQREGCKVSLYQDAHVPGSFNPNVTLAGGQRYQPKSCWEDVFRAIDGAKHIIYITGWSIYTEISLTRDSTSPEETGTTLGELLKKKAKDDGVQVLLLLWEDITARVPFYGGKMATHCKETKKYFRGTNVRCVLRQNPARATCSHHQKTVVVDSELPGEERRQIVSFVGGIDLCHGRYDTPEHSLFRTLNTVHRYDFHQPSISGSKYEKGGPREPWHDIHARLEGPIAWDVLNNFVQRWKKQGANDFPFKKLTDIIIDPSEFNNRDPETWCVQLLRSIESAAADFEFPKSPEAAANFVFPNTQEAAADGVGLVSRQNKIIDQSIEAAYISAIRRAKNFIYIESQYFLGSSFAWNSKGIKLDEIKAWHLIPKELSLKIARKIKDGERFTVYVVVPMWPEGIPEGKAVQEILFYQNKTIEMMYKDVVQALKDNNRSDEDPLNYLAFFCLGNREKKQEEEEEVEEEEDELGGGYQPTERPEQNSHYMKAREYDPPESPEQNSHYMKAQEARRFMIYVHSKMMIVDDEYIIIGSANINQRSMDGARDTEIAIGAYQPYHLATTRDPARGQIYGFRMSLWYEHLGSSERCFNKPQDKECIERVNELAEDNWKQYSSTGSPESDLRGHLLPYPVEITEDGDLVKLKDFEFFPDTEASVLGRQSVFSSRGLGLRFLRTRYAEEC